MKIVSQSSAVFEQQSTWYYLIEQAREKINYCDWDGACIFYKKAFFIAEKLLRKQKSCSQPCPLKRYLSTAEEFAFVMKKNNFDCALAMFISQIKDNVSQQETQLPVTTLTGKLTTIASTPQQELERFYKVPISIHHKI